MCVPFLRSQCLPLKNVTALKAGGSLLFLPTPFLPDELLYSGKHRVFS